MVRVSLQLFLKQLQGEQILAVGKPDDRIGLLGLERKGAPAVAAGRGLLAALMMDSFPDHLYDTSERMFANLTATTDTQRLFVCRLFRPRRLQGCCVKSILQLLRFSNFTYSVTIGSRVRPVACP